MASILKIIAITAKVELVVFLFLEGAVTEVALENLSSMNSIDMLLELDRRIELGIADLTRGLAIMMLLDVDGQLLSLGEG